MTENEERKSREKADGAQAAGGEDAELERSLRELLESGELTPEDKEAEQLRRLPPRYEVRIQTTFDPIVEETLRFRQFGTELDDRYDKYLERARARSEEAAEAAGPDTAAPEDASVRGETGGTGGTDTDATDAAGPGITGSSGAEPGGK